MVRTTVALLALAVAAAAAGCGGDGDSPSGTPPTTPGASSGPPVALEGTTNAQGSVDLTGAGGTVELSLKTGDSYFDPTYVRTAPGAVVTVEVQNIGQRPHTFTVASGADVTIQPGAMAEATVTVPTDGALRFFCKFHAAGGMQGAFYTAAGQTAGTGQSGYGG